MSTPGEVEQRDSFAEIGFVGVSVPIDLALATGLLLAPLVRHSFEEGRIHQAIELVDVHGVNAIVQPLRFSLKSLDRFFMLAPLVGMAGVKRIAHPFQHLAVEPQPAEQFGELRFEHFLADIFAAAIGGLALALIGVACAVVIDVAFLLDLADYRAAAGMAGDQAREGKIPPPLLGAARIAAVHHILNPLPQFGRNDGLVAALIVLPSQSKRPV